MKNKPYLFIALSALIHFSVLGIYELQTSEVIPVEHGRSAISVEITQTTNTISKKKTPKQIKPITKTKVITPSKTVIPVISKTTIPTHALSINNNTKTQIIETTDTPAEKWEPVTVQPHITNINKPVDINTDAVIAVLQKELSKHFYYPQSAQRKNWQGQVILSFTILPNGIINKIKVKQSSGYDILDNAAIDALEEVNKQSELAIALNGYELQQLLPINYKLTY